MTCDQSLAGASLLWAQGAPPTFVPDLVSWCGRWGAIATGPLTDVLGGGLSGRELELAAFAWSRQ